jgi:hypothetical protein
MSMHSVELKSSKPERRGRRNGRGMPNAKTRKPRTDRYNDELPEELDFSKLTFLGRGLFAGRIKAGGRQVRLAADVAKVFRNEREVNDALRLLIRASKTVMKS